MSQTSRLSIVVDTQQAKQKLIDFTAQLKTATTQATNLATQLRAPMGAAGANAASTSLAGLTAQAAKAQLQQDKLTQSAAKTAIQQQKLAQEVIKTSIAQNNLARSAQAVVIGNQRAEAAARKAASGITALSSATNTLNRNWANINLSARTFTPATEAARALSVQINSVTAAAARVAPAANSAAAGLNNLNSASQRADRSARGLHGTLNKLYTVMNSGLVAVTGLGFIKTAAEMQNLNNQIRLVTDSEREYLGMKQLVGKIADENFADINSTINLYQKSVRALENLGKSQADSIKFTEAVSLAMRTGGRSAGENAAAILQLGQAMGAGVVMGDEFRSISENAPVLLKLVAKEMGVLQGDLKKLSAEGKITAEIMYNAMTKNMAELEQLAKKMPLTMGQAFTVAKNNYKKYTDELMNSTGGVSDKISGMLIKISANFDTIAKVGIAAVSLGLLSIVANLATATKAMALFNLVTSANPLILIISGFLLLTSAIYGTNEVLTISGLAMSDFFDGTKSMIDDAKDWWEEYSEKVKKYLGITTSEVEDANKKQEKSFLSLYRGTEEGFSGLIQHIGTSVGSTAAIFRTFFTMMQTLAQNTVSILENIGRGAHNAGSWVRRQLGLSDNRVDYAPIKMLNPLETFKEIDSRNEDFWEKLAKRWNLESGVTDKEYKDTLMMKMGEDFARGMSFQVPLGNTKGIPYLPVYQTKFTGILARGEGNFNASTSPTDPQAALANERKKLREDEEKRLEILKEQDEEIKKQAGSTELLRLAVMGGKDWGIYQKGGKYGDKRGYGGHSGIDIPSPKGTQVYAPEGGTVSFKGSVKSGGGRQLILLGDSGAKYDFLHLDSYDVQEGRVEAGVGIAKSGNSGSRSGGKNYGKKGDGYGDHLHVGVTKNGKRVDPTNFKVSKIKGGYDDTIGKYNEQRMSDEARRLEEQLKLQSELRAQYGSEDLRLSMELQKEFARIASSGLSTDEQDRMAVLAQQDKDRKLAIYEKGLQDQLNAFTDYQQTERYLIEQARNDAKFAAKNKPELMRPENAQVLEDTLAAIDVKYDYDIQQHDLALDKQKREMYSFRANERDLIKNSFDEQISAAKLMYDELKDVRIDALTQEKQFRLDELDLSQEEEALGLFEYASTDRRMFEEGWRLKIARAKIATDELKDIRIKAEEAAYAKGLELFNLNEKKKLLSLREGGMGAGEYMLANQRLNIQGINDSNMTPEEKRLEANAARQPLNDALTGIMSEINPQSENERIEQEYRERLEILDAYESQYTSLVGVQSAERIAIEKSYQDAKRDLMITKGGETLSDLTMLSKAFLGEQSSLYKGLFAMEKAYTLASVLIKNQEAISKAWASAPFPYNLGAVASTVAGTAGIASAVAGIVPQGFEKGGYTGSMGTKDIAGVVHGQEYVFDAQSTKRIGVDNLNAMRSGKSVGGGDVNISVNVDAKGNAQVSGDNERMGRDMANGIKAVVMDTLRKEKRQGGMLYA